MTALSYGLESLSGEEVIPIKAFFDKSNAC
jgi:hypothetical protein